MSVQTFMAMHPMLQQVKTLLQPQGFSFNFATLSGTTEMLHKIEYDVKY